MGGGVGGGGGNYVRFSDSHLNLQFRNPHAKTPHSCLTASGYQSIPAQKILTFMFGGIPLPEHPCPNYKTAHV